MTDSEDIDSCDVDESVFEVIAVDHDHSYTFRKDNVGENSNTAKDTTEDIGPVFSKNFKLVSANTKKCNSADDSLQYLAASPTTSSDDKSQQAPPASSGYEPKTIPEANESQRWTGNSSLLLDSHIVPVRFNPWQYEGDIDQSIDCVIQNGSIYSCSKCGFKVHHYKEECLRHVRMKHFDYRQWKCPYCPYHCSHKFRMLQHLFDLHLSVGRKMIPVKKNIIRDAKLGDELNVSEDIDASGSGKREATLIAAIRSTASNPGVRELKCLLCGLNFIHEIKMLSHYEIHCRKIMRDAEKKGKTYGSAPKIENVVLEYNDKNLRRRKNPKVRIKKRPNYYNWRAPEATLQEEKRKLQLSMIPSQTTQVERLERRPFLSLLTKEKKMKRRPILSNKASDTPSEKCLDQITSSSVMIKDVVADGDRAISHATTDELDKLVYVDQNEKTSISSLTNTWLNYKSHPLRDSLSNTDTGCSSLKSTLSNQQTVIKPSISIEGSSFSEALAASTFSDTTDVVNNCNSDGLSLKEHRFVVPKSGVNISLKRIQNECVNEKLSNGNTLCKMKTNVKKDFAITKANKISKVSGSLKKVLAGSTKSSNHGTNSQKGFKCKICNVSFNSMPLVRAHISRHLAEKGITKMDSIAPHSTNQKLPSVT